MSQPALLESQASPGAAQLAGFWQLPAGRALKLRPRRAGVLRIAQGRAWATFDGPHAGHANALGDHVLLAGEQLAVAAGKALVIESLDQAGGPAVLFAWTPDPATAAVVQAGAGLAQTTRDLRLALQSLLLGHIGAWVPGGTDARLQCAGVRDSCALGRMATSVPKPLA